MSPDDRSHPSDPGVTPQLEELNDDDLLELHRLGRETLRRGLPLSEGVKRYGIRDHGALKAWVMEIGKELERRGVEHEPATW